MKLALLGSLAGLAASVVMANEEYAHEDYQEDVIPE